jgi:hypothetical protein
MGLIVVMPPREANVPSCGALSPAWVRAARAVPSVVRVGTGKNVAGVTVMGTGAQRNLAAAGEYNRPPGGQYKPGGPVQIAARELTVAMSTVEVGCSPWRV